MQGLHFDLVGLQHGLTMTVEECDEASDMILLCLHGSITLDSDKKVNINISDEGLRYPPYFKYYIRDVLKDIHGSKERNSWIFLALLHLYTSDIIPDPFTKRTGLSRCIEILRSDRCRGNLLCSIDSTKGGRFILKYMSAKDSVSLKNILTSDKFYKLSDVGNIESYLDILTGRISILADELALFSSQSKLNRKNSITSEELLSPIVCQLSHSFDINPGDFNSYWLNLYQICLSAGKSKRKMKEFTILMCLISYKF